MTKKDFEVLAIALGLGVRNGPRDVTAQQAQVAMLTEVVDSLAWKYPRFDRDRFMSWVFEVSRGERGVDGKLRKACAGCADAADMAALGWDDYYCRAHRSA